MQQQTQQTETINVMKGGKVDFESVCVLQVLNALDTDTFITKVNNFETILCSQVGHKENNCPDIKDYNAKEKVTEEEIDKMCFHVKIALQKLKWEDDIGDKWKTSNVHREILAQMKWDELYREYKKNLAKRAVGYLGKEECNADCCVEKRKAKMKGEDNG